MPVWPGEVNRRKRGIDPTLESVSRAQMAFGPIHLQPELLLLMTTMPSFIKRCSLSLKRLAGAVLIVLSSTFQCQAQEHRNALCIGIDLYDDEELPDLETPVRDSESLSLALRSREFAPVGGVGGANFDLATFDAAVSKFEAIGNRLGGVGIFYFAGHGVQIGGANYLIPADASLADLPNGCISLESVMKKMRGFKWRILILDSCRDNPLGENAVDGLARFDETDLEEGELVYYAAEAGGVAYDDLNADGEHSPFTGALLEELKDPKGDIYETFANVSEKVRSLTKDKQVIQNPIMQFDGTGEFLRDFKFAKGAPALDLSGVAGKITAPSPNVPDQGADVILVNPDFDVQGTVGNLVEGAKLWLAVRKHTGLWPKQNIREGDAGEFRLDDVPGVWEGSIHEGGSDSGEFSLVLYAVTPGEDNRIRNWLKACEFYDRFPSFDWIEGKKLDEIKIRLNRGQLNAGKKLVIRFDELAFNLDQPEFNIFRAEQESSRQWISQSLDRMKPRASLIPCLKLRTAIPEEELFNGWYLKLGERNWSRYANGDLLLRLRARASELSTFKVEVKTGGSSTTYNHDVELSEADFETMDQEGFVEVRIPFPELATSADWSKISELTIVFEHDRLLRDDKRAELWLDSIWVTEKPVRPPAPLGQLPPPPKLTASDRIRARELLKELGRKTWLWFEASLDAGTGLVLDRRRNSTEPDERKRGSIAATGYYLSMLPAAVGFGEITEAEAEQRALTTLRSVEAMDNRFGVLPHFLDIRNGNPIAGTEHSILDTSILLNGAMVVSEAYGGEVSELSDGILDRVEWPRFLIEAAAGKPILLSMGWKDDQMLPDPMDVRSSELAMAQLLAVGSRTHPVVPEVYYNARVDRGKVAGIPVLNPRHGLFTSYYGLGWLADGLEDRDGVIFSENARYAAVANREHCLNRSKHETYAMGKGGWWGISAGDVPDEEYLAAAPGSQSADGFVWPMTALAAAPWAAEYVEADLLRWSRSKSWDEVNRAYGLAPFNLEEPFWSAPDLIGIDLGSFYLGLEAHLGEDGVRKLWMSHPVAKQALERLEFTEGE